MPGTQADPFNLGDSCPIFRNVLTFCFLSSPPFSVLILELILMWCCIPPWSSSFLFCSFLFSISAFLFHLLYFFNFQHIYWKVNFGSIFNTLLFSDCSFFYSILFLFHGCSIFSCFWEYSFCGEFSVLHIISIFFPGSFICFFCLHLLLLQVSSNA